MRRKWKFRKPIRLKTLISKALDHGTQMRISANDIKASNGRTSGNALHPLTDKIYPTCTSARRPQDRVDRMSSAHVVEEIPNTYLTPKEKFLDIEDDDQINEFIEPIPY